MTVDSDFIRRRWEQYCEAADTLRERLGTLLAQSAVDHHTGRPPMIKLLKGHALTYIGEQDKRWIEARNLYADVTGEHEWCERMSEAGAAFRRWLIGDGKPDDAWNFYALLQEPPPPPNRTEKATGERDIVPDEDGYYESAASNIFGNPRPQLSEAYTTEAFACALDELDAACRNAAEVVARLERYPGTANADVPERDDALDRVLALVDGMLALFEPYRRGDDGQDWGAQTGYPYSWDNAGPLDEVCRLICRIRQVRGGTWHHPRPLRYDHPDPDHGPASIAEVTLATLKMLRKVVPDLRAASWAGLEAAERSQVGISIANDPATEPTEPSAADELRTWRSVPKEEQRTVLLSLIHSFRDRGQPLPVWRDCAAWIAANHHVEVSHETVRRAFRDYDELREALKRLKTLAYNATAKSNVAGLTGTAVDAPKRSNPAAWEKFTDEELATMSEEELESLTDEGLGDE